MGWQNYFNPRSREGSDGNAVKTVLGPIDFNPRSREGSDKKAGGTACRIYYFNPRSREGSDVEDVQDLKQSIISIHAPAKGATVDVVQIFESMFNFNPRSREGSDCPNAVYHVLYAYFNPRSREGSDGEPECAGYISRRFQSTLPRRERQDRRLQLAEKQLISIHAPAKGATAILYNKFHFLCIILYILSAIT